MEGIFVDQSLRVGRATILPAAPADAVDGPKQSGRAQSERVRIGAEVLRVHAEELRGAAEATRTSADEALRAAEEVRRNLDIVCSLAEDMRRRAEAVRASSQR